jgi:hypothetical protein
LIGFRLSDICRPIDGGRVQVFGVDAPLVLDDVENVRCALDGATTTVGDGDSMDGLRINDVLSLRINVDGMVVVEVVAVVVMPNGGGGIGGGGTKKFGMTGTFGDATGVFGFLRIPCGGVSSDADVDAVCTGGGIVIDNGTRLDESTTTDGGGGGDKS